MRIDSNSIIQQVSNVRPKTVNGTDAVAGKEVDSVELSTRAADFQAAMDALKGAPVVREDRVVELRRQLEAGTLTTDGDALAAKLLKRSPGE